MDTTTCSRLLREEFPEQTAEFDDPIWVGLLHLEVSVLARLAENAIDRRDYHTLQRCYDFVTRAVSEGDAAVKNAMSVSFLENILLVAETPEQQEAEQRLPEGLRRDLAELRRRWERLAVEAQKHEGQ
ncbi:MAG TPA: hypothetical protein VFS12_08800 [Terriglobia bacterium]|nr:hypothetical protein [Terriglobia bacterium]